MIFSKTNITDNNIILFSKLYNANGEAFGQIIVGHPTSKKVISNKDMIEVEMVVNLAASIINGEAHKKV